MGDYKVIVSRVAEESMMKHLAYLSAFSKEAAVKERKTIMDALRKLKTDADIYPFFDEDRIPRNKYHKLVVSKRIIVLYQIKDGTVYVDYLFDTKQDYYWLIR